MYWILDLEDEYTKYGLYGRAAFQECKGNIMFWSRVEWVENMGFIRAVKKAYPRQGPTLDTCNLARGGCSKAPCYFKTDIRSIPRKGGWHLPAFLLVLLFE